MALSKYRIGQLIKIVDERNSFDINDFMESILTKNLCQLSQTQKGLMKQTIKLLEKTDLSFRECKPVEISVLELVCIWVMNL